jgi:PAS domain S-box-containing protein/putative nucleotidyltransferase with HDIG domain
MAQSEPIRILYIEDDPGLARLVQKRLGKKGYTVDIASDGEEGLAKYKAGSYDLLFVDQSLPVHDGLEVIRILGSNGALPPTVMITGTGDERVAVEAMKLGAGDYIVKDVEGGYLELLPSVIEKMLQQRRAIEEKQRMGKKLQESEQRYRTLVDSIDLGLNLIDIDYNIVMASAAEGKHFKTPISNLIGKKCFREFEKRDEACPHCPGVQAMATGQPAEAETKGVGDDGIPYDVRIRAFPSFGDDGSVTGFIEITENITERKQAEEALRIKDNAIASSITAIAIAEFGGNMTYVNPEFLKMWGYEDEREVLGKPAAKFWHMNKKAGRIIKTMLKEQKVVGELKAKRKDGSLFDIQVSASTVADENDKPVWMMASCIDITERKRADEALRESQRLLESTFKSLREAVFIIDADTMEIMDCNPAATEIFGYSLQEMLGRTTKILHVDEAALEKFRGYLFRAVEEQGFLFLPEFMMKRRDGMVFYTEHSVAPLEDEHGKRIGWVSVVRDITEHKEAEQTLLEHKKALQNSFFGTAEALSKVIEDRDPYTSGHSAGVAGLAEAMARAMGFSEEQTTGIYIAGVLHDIGKMAVPVEILVKPGRLTDMEMSLIQRHPEAGYEILKGIDFPWPVSQATLQHHERMDGSGYPQGVKGDTIIREARILAVADVVDAMTHHRPYRPAFSVQDAREEISKGRGRIYDPQVVDACLEVLEGEEAFTSSVYSMSSTSPQLRRGSTKPSVLPTTTMMRFSGRR